MMTRGAVETGAAAEIEVLIPEARERARRRRRRTVALAVGLVTVLAAGSLVARIWGGGGPGTADGSAGSAPLARTGAVIGYIERCVGIARPGQLPPYPAGAVEALRGRETLRRLLSGPLQLVLPKTVVATEQVRTGQMFAFHLPPGRYVLLAHYDQGATSLLSLSIRAGPVVRRNLPNLCK
jgi:hypothetical protein